MDPQTVTLRDKTKVTYSWYKFVDQPALRNLNLTDEQRAQLQLRVETIHWNWKTTGKYMKEPSKGSLVSVDQNLIVDTLQDFEIGYVPIVTKQEWP